MKILIGTNIFGNNPRQYIARESWLHLQKLYPDLIELVAVQFIDEQPDFLSDKKIEYNDYKLPVIWGLDRSSQSMVTGSTKKIPFIKDILTELCVKASLKSDITHFAYINSDCILTDNFIKHMLSNEINALAISRLDVAPIEKFNDLVNKGVTVLRNEIAGFDMFVFRKEWWGEHGGKFKDYLIGQPLFDVLYAGLIMLFGGKIYNDSTKPLVCHIFHENTSHNDTIEKKYNEDIINRYMFEKLVVNMMHYHLQYNLCRRKPWGRFLAPTEDEQIFTERFFESMRLDTPNEVKYIE